jgi:alkylation response protein AidB-like acyl-CoA dehydrogenase
MSQDMLDMLADAAASFARPDAARVRALRGTADGFDRARWRAMAELGWFSVVVPEAAGGLGLGAAAAATIATALGRAAAPEPFVASGLIAPWCLSRASGSGAASALAALLAGEQVIALAWQPEQGCLEPLETGLQATRQPDGSLRLSGAARFVAPASADRFLVAARLPEGLALGLLPREREGLVRTDEPTADGSASALLRLTDVPLAADELLAQGPQAVALLRDALDLALVASAAELVGLMDHALDTTLDYLRTRQQFGKPIGSFQALQHRAVDIWIQRQLARAAVDAAIAVLDSPAADARARTQAASSAKARAAHAALLLCNQSVQLHGAIGFTDEYELGIYLNRALSLSAWLGNAAEHRRRWGALADAAGAGTA